MRSHQIKYFNQGRQSVLNDLKNGTPINADHIFTLLNDSYTEMVKGGEMEDRAIQRDANNELLSMTSEKFKTADALAYELSGRIHALAEFANSAQAEGYRIKAE